jgi:hypothetical protein
VTIYFENSAAEPSPRELRSSIPSPETGISSTILRGRSRRGGGWEREPEVPHRKRSSPIRSADRRHSDARRLTSSALRVPFSSCVVSARTRVGGHAAYFENNPAKPSPCALGSRPPLTPAGALSPHRAAAEAGYREGGEDQMGDGVPVSGEGTGGAPSQTTASKITTCGTIPAHFIGLAWTGVRALLCGLHHRPAWWRQITRSTSISRMGKRADAGDQGGRRRITTFNNLRILRDTL